MSYTTLKEHQREIREHFPEGVGLRVHRALSWLNRAEQESDPDSRFIFLWIAFNAAYAVDDRERDGFSERGRFNKFLGKLVGLDAERRLCNLVWESFTKSIRVLISNRYVYQPFWDYQSGLIEQDAWHSKFELGKAIAHRALGSMDTTRVLSTGSTCSETSWSTAARPGTAR